MKTFKDSNGKVWTLTVNVNVIKRVRDLVKFDLLKVVEDQKSIEALSDPVLLVDVLYAVCKTQADADGISDEKFAECIADGDVIEAASNALLEEITDFFQPHRRNPLKKALAKIQQIRDRAAQIQIQRIESPELEEQVMRMVTDAVNAPLPTSGDSSTKARASSALTPVP